MIRHIRWQILLVIVGVGLLVALLVYVALNFTTEWVAGRGGTYVEGLAGTPRFVNPLLCRPHQVDGDLCALIFNGLTRIDQRGEVVPDLAQRWEISPDGLAYTFHLRPGVRWHDGAAFSAADVVFTIELMQDPSFPGPPDWGELWRSATVTQLDARTVRFELEEPNAPFLDYTSVGILPRHVLEGVPAGELLTHPFNLNPVGTGVYQFTEVVTDTAGISHVILSANPFYFDHRPLITRLQFKFYPTYQAVYEAYLEHQVQGIGRVDAANLEQAQENQDLQLFTSALPRYALLYLNLDNETVPFFQEREVRQALLYALDRRAIIDRALKGQGTIAHSPILPNSWAHDPDIPIYAYNPDKAMDLLRETGWEAKTATASPSITETTPISPTVIAWFKDRRPLTFTVLVPDNPSRLAVAEEMVKQWNRVGILAEIKPVGDGLLSEYLEPRRYEAALVDIDLTMAGDPDPYTFWHQTKIDPPGQNYGGYDSREVSEILEQARLTPDREARKELYYQFQQLFAQDVPALLLYHPVYTYAVDQYVYDVRVGPLVRPGDRFLGIADWYLRWRRVIRSETQADASTSLIDRLTP